MGWRSWTVQRNKLLGALGRGRWGKGRESGFQASVLGLLTPPPTSLKVLGSTNEMGTGFSVDSPALRLKMINTNNSE